MSQQIIPGLGALLNKIRPKEVIDSIGNALDKNITNKEELLLAKLEVEKEVNRHFEEMERLYVQEKHSARTRDIEINNSEHSSWLAKNVASIIALFIIATSSAILFVCLFGFVKTDKTIEAQIMQGVFQVLTMVLAFYFGASQQNKGNITVQNQEVKK